MPSQRAVTSPAEEDQETPVGRPGGVVSPTNCRMPPSVPMTVRVPSGLRTLSVPAGAVAWPRAAESALDATMAAALLKSGDRSR